MAARTENTKGFNHAGVKQFHQKIIANQKSNFVT